MARKSTTVALDGTNRSLQNLYRAYNRCYFGSQLDPEIRVRFSTKPMRKRLGEYDSGNEEIVIDTRLRSLNRFTCWVLLHEMNHVYVGPDKEHGPAFDVGMFRLASIGAMVGIW